MFDHLWHIFAVAGASIGGLLLILGGHPKGRSTPSAPPIVPETPIVEPEMVPTPIAPQGLVDGLTGRAAGELVGHEAIVLEAYKDSENIWTWGIGVTDASGHNVERYIDHPQPVAFCLEIFVWLLRTKYLPAVLQAFAGHTLTETQLAAALSFHYNTGAIRHATFVDHWKAGDMEGARHLFMVWDKPPAIIERRQEECNLFFDGTWSGDGKANVLPVVKPSYHPDFHHAVRMDVLTPLQQILGG